MLVFIIPIKSPKLSRDWALTSALFERSARAICNQTSPKFRVVVVCNEKPVTQFHHPNIHYVEVDFPPPMSDPNEAATRGYEFALSKDIARKNADKARKIRTGLDYAERFQPTHTMVVDADDLVSNRLAEFVAQNPQGAGWYFKTGYLYTEGSRFLFVNRQHFNVICGTSVIVSYAQRDLLFSNPEFYHHCFENPPGGLVPLPFPGTVYSMVNGDNIWMSADTRKSIFGTLVKRLFSRQIFAVMWKFIRNWPAFLTQAKRDEFGLFPIEKPRPAPTAQAPAPQAAQTIAS